MNDFMPSDERSAMFLVLPHSYDDLIKAFGRANASVYRVTSVDIKEGKPESGDAAVPLDQMKLHQLLKELGVPKKLQGYRYVAQAITMVAQDPSLALALTKQVYPAIAKKYSVSAYAVERAIRYAVEQACSRCDIELLNRYFGNTADPRRGKLTNGEFIVEMAHLLREPQARLAGLN